MGHRLKMLSSSFIWRLIATFGLTLLFPICIWAYVTVRLQLNFMEGILFLAAVSFFITTPGIFIFVHRSIKRPIEQLIAGTENLASGNYDTRIELKQSDELATLARAINDMGSAIGKKEAALNKQRDEYRRLFEMMPCIMTVQDRDYRLVSYNRQFEHNFHPKPGDYCFWAYKGRTEKCTPCPVEQTFTDGKSHYSQEAAILKDGTIRHWIVRTAPIENDHGEIVAAMEMSLDITHRKLLQEALAQSEKKYYDIFENIPNPVFVLDIESLEILDCNGRVRTVYGWTNEEMIGRCFLELFNEADRPLVRDRIHAAQAMNKIRQIGKSGKMLYANIWISPSDYPDRRVLLVTTSDITLWMETEQQLIQAGKMATLGEMATGVAHELNQPLTVIKTAGSFFKKKIIRKEPIDEETLAALAEEIDGHVDRATRIINHMREFGRKAEETLVPVQIEAVLRSAFDLFSQQLKLRGIEVRWEIEEGLPPILGDYGRLEQVFVNLLLNARDAVEEKWIGATEAAPGQRCIILAARCHGDKVLAEVRDTGGGIPEAERERIFEPFFTTKAVGRGTGLGLSISYGIVKECGGTIDVVGAAEGGACFRLTFPATDLDGIT